MLKQFSSKSFKYFNFKTFHSLPLKIIYNSHTGRPVKSIQTTTYQYKIENKTIRPHRI